MDEILQGILGRRGGGPSPFARSAPREHTLDVSLEEAYRGTTRLVEMSGMDGKKRRLEVKVPAGVWTGFRMSVDPDKGRPGAGQGEIIFSISVLPHDRYRRVGNDIHVETPVSLYERHARRGSEGADVKGFGGAEAAAGDSKWAELPAEGSRECPFTGGWGWGNAYATVKVMLPTDLSQRESELVIELKEMRDRRGSK